MSYYERIASALIGTPLQLPAEGLRWASSLPKRLKHPELSDIFLEAKRLRNVMVRTITREMNCIDVGCHLGSVLNEIVNLSPLGRHIAVEPLAYKAAWLRKKYPQVAIHEVALGEQDAIVEFFYDPRNSGFSGLGRHGQGANQTLQLQCKRLDDIVSPGMPIGFMKIDVEGGEYNVFKGATRVLSESQPIVVFECTKTGLAALGITPQEVFGLLRHDLRYRIFLPKNYLASGPPLDYAGFQDSMNYPFQAFNYVAVPDSQEFRGASQPITCN